MVLPCNLQRMIWNTKKAFNINRATKSDLSPIKVIEDVENLLSKCKIYEGDDEFTETANSNATFLFKCLVRSTLNSKRVCEELRLTSVAFDQLIKDVEHKFQQAKVNL